MQISHTEKAESIQSKQKDLLEGISNKEILKQIDPEIKVPLRKYYLMFLYGQKIPKKYSNLLLQNIKEILNHE